MKSSRVVSMLVLVVCSITMAQSQSKAPETLGSVKQKYLNQRVVLGGVVMDIPRQGSFMRDWYFATLQPSGQYKFDMSQNALASDKGQPGTIVAIQLNDALDHSSGQQVNALGEVVSPDQTVNPYFDIVVKLDDGHILMNSYYPATVSQSLSLASEHGAITSEMSAKIGSVIGSNLYAVEFSRLYQLDTTLEEMQGRYELAKRIPMTNVPLLQPLQITAAKYLEIPDVVVFKLKLPSGQEALSITDSSFFANEKKDVPFLVKISGFLLASIPPSLTTQEVAAIKEGSIFRGMSKEAVDYAVGFPKKENDWGKGGKQLIYSDTFIIYIDNEEKVADWQSFKD